MRHFLGTERVLHVVLPPNKGFREGFDQFGAGLCGEGIDHVVKRAVPHENRGEVPGRRDFRRQRRSQGKIAGKRDDARQGLRLTKPRVKRHGGSHRETAEENSVRGGAGGHEFTDHLAYPQVHAADAAFVLPAREVIA